MSTSAPDPGTEPGRAGPSRPADAAAGTPPDRPEPVDFDPFRFGRPEPDSPAAAAFPHLFPPQPQPVQGQPDQGQPAQGQPAQEHPAEGQRVANPGSAPPTYPGWGPPPGSGYPPPAPGTGLGYPPPGSDPGSGFGPGGPAADPSASYAYPHPPYGTAPGPGYAPPQGYSYPPPGGGDRPGNGKAVAGFVLGIVAVVLFFFTLFDLIPIVLAFVFSVQGLRASKRGKGQRGLAVAGLVLASVATVIVVVFLTFFAFRVNHCQQHHDQGTKSYNQCLIDL